MPGVHAEIAPSSLARIVQCAGTVMLSRPFLDAPPEPYAIEGEAAHWVARQYVEKRANILEGTMTPAGVPVDDDMIDGAILWRDTVGMYGICETPVVIEAIHPTQCWGTPDWFRYDPIEHVLWVADYKYGHLFVEVWDNWQLIAYAIGIIETMGLDMETLTLRMTVVQPRCYHQPSRLGNADGRVREWRGPATALREPVHRAWMQAQRAFQDEPPTVTGPECTYCPARHVCKTLRDADSRIMDYTGTADPVGLNSIAVGVELRYLTQAIKLLEARKSGLETQGLEMLRRGQQVPFWRVGHGRGAVKWEDDTPVEEIAAMGALMGVNLLKPPKLITPKQAKDAKLSPEIVALYSRPVPGAARLEYDDALTVRKLFNKY